MTIRQVMQWCAAFNEECARLGAAATPRQAPPPESATGTRTSGTQVVQVFQAAVGGMVTAPGVFFAEDMARDFAETAAGAALSWTRDGDSVRAERDGVMFTVYTTVVREPT